MTFCPPRRLATRVAAVAFSVGTAGVLLPATAFAQSDDGDGPRNPPTQEEIAAKRKCMAEHGVDLPEPKLDENGRPQRPMHRPDLTDEQRAAFRAAAEACGLPGRGGRFGPGGHRHPQLTDEQRACLEEQGIKRPEKPTDGERPSRPTDEQRAAFRKAAEACGITLPDKPPSDRPPPDDADGNGSNGTSTESTSTTASS
jgi:hypothetical protein